MILLQHFFTNTITLTTYIQKKHLDGKINGETKTKNIERCNNRLKLCARSMIYNRCTAEYILKRNQICFSIESKVCPISHNAYIGYFFL